MPCTRRIINWSNVPSDIVECIIGHSSWPDRIRIRAVCKAWSVPYLHIPTIDTDRVPWAMRGFDWCLSEEGDSDTVSGLIDPFGRRYPMKVRKECRIFDDAESRASAYGWVLFDVSRSLYLYSPFTTEMIKLPDEYAPYYEVATFSLNATSPKSVVFLLHVDDINRKVCVKLCSPGDNSWKYFEFSNGFDGINRASTRAAYVNGVFYCVFSQGQLGAFNVELEEWTILAAHLPPNHSRFDSAKLIVSGSDLLLWDRSDSSSSILPYELFKFDFSETRWVSQSIFNNYVLFIGGTCFSVPAVGELSQRYPSFPRRSESSVVNRNSVKEVACATAWVQPPLGRIWRADDLINAD